VIDIPYIVEKLKIDPKDIVVINKKRKYDDSSDSRTYELSYGCTIKLGDSYYDIPLRAEYELIEGEDGELNSDGLPTAVGKYKVRIYVDSENYEVDNAEGYLATELNVVQVHKVIFREGSLEISVSVEHGGKVKPPLAPSKNEEYVWFDDDANAEFDLNTAIEKDMTLRVKYVTE